MKTLKERYYHIVGTPTKDEADYCMNVENYVMARVYYHEGGYNLFTYKKNERAYFMSCRVIGRAQGMQTTAICLDPTKNNGRKIKLKEVSRQSKKAALDSIVYFDENIDRFVKETWPELELEFDEEKIPV